MTGKEVIGRLRRSALHVPRLHGERIVNVHDGWQSFGSRQNVFRERERVIDRVGPVVEKLLTKKLGRRLIHVVAVSETW